MERAPPTEKGEEAPSRQRVAAGARAEMRATQNTMPPERRWMQTGSEPSIADLLSDPTVRILMQADGVMVDDILAIISKIMQRRVQIPAFGEFREGPATPRSRGFHIAACKTAGLSGGKRAQ
jgi:glutathione S-transferase